MKAPLPGRHDLWRAHLRPTLTETVRGMRAERALHILRATCAAPPKSPARSGWRAVRIDVGHLAFGLAFIAIGVTWLLRDAGRT